MKWPSIVTSCIVAALGMSSSTVAFAAQSTSAQELSDLKRRLQILEKRVEAEQGTVEPTQTTGQEVQAAQVGGLPNEPDVGVIRDVVRFGTGPYFGLDSSYDGSDLLVNEPSIHKDLGILRQNKYLNEHIGHVSDSGPRVQLSGTVEAYVQQNSQPFGLMQTDTNTLLGLVERKNFMGASADIDFSAQINTWWTGYIRLDGDVEEPSIVTLDQSFIILGDLQQLPFYATLGRLYVPSGYFSSNMASAPVTRSVGRTKATALVLGESYKGLDINVFAYDGRSHREIDTDRVDEWGGNIQYTTRNLFYKGYFFRTGVGYNSNVASADGMSNSFVLGGNGVIDNFIPATDVYATLGVGILSVTGEYVFLNKSFQYDEISFNGEGARPEALNVEATWAFPAGRWFRKATNITLNYGQTQESAALGISRYLYGGAFQVVAMKNTLLTLEYLHKRDYGKTDTFSSEEMPFIQTGTNNTDNQLRGQVDIYF